MAGDSRLSQNVHLRTACDPCSAAKVRCDKKQPACERCVQTKLPCSYSRSRRHGRRLWHRRGGGTHAQLKMATAATTSEATKQGGEVAIVPAITSSPGTARWNPPLMAYPPAPSISDQGLDAVLHYDQRYPEDASSAYMPSWPFVNDDGPGTGLDFSSYTTLLDAAEPSLCLSEVDPFVSVLDPKHHEGTSQGKSQSHPSTAEKDSSSTPSSSATINTHDCEARAISILGSMQHGAMQSGAASCTSIPAHHSNVGSGGYAPLNLRPGFDRVLATNKAALDGCAALMTCSCALCPHIILLHVSILSKALFWYRVAAATGMGTDGSPPEENNSVSGGSSDEDYSDPPTPGRFSVDPTTIRVGDGALRLDAEDESELRRALLLRELRRAGTVIDALIGGVDRSAILDAGDDVVRSSVEYSLGGIARVKDELQNVIRKVSQQAPWPCLPTCDRWSLTSLLHCPDGSRLTELFPQVIFT